jgi:uncharacterized RDD family membrane protein YckC
MTNTKVVPRSPAGPLSDPPWLRRVSANELRTISFPRCSETCALFPKLDDGECADTCRWKFDHRGTPIPELAGRLRRWCARLLDSFLAGLILIPGILLLMELRPDLVSEEQVLLYTAILLSAYYAIYGVLNGWMLHRRGQTIGKWILGIRIMRTDHRPVSFARLFLLRELVTGMFQALPWIGGGVRFIDVVFILGSDRQCLHDMLADTKVVRIRRMGT